jgi:RNA polymerase sigma-70 factor (ECF subfamily)
MAPGFDPASDADVEGLAGGLLHLFRQNDDRAAFELMFELCVRQLMDMARRITRRVGLAIDPEDLVSTYMCRLFTDLRKDQPRVRSFFGLSYTAMRNEALNQVRLLRRAQARHLAYDRWLRDHHGPSDPAVVTDHAEQIDQVRRLGAVFLAIVSRCFHQLGERDRRILLAREVDGLSYDEIAETLELPRGQVGMILKRARERFGRNIAATFAAAPEGEA